MMISHFQKDLSLKRDLGEIIYLIIQYLSCVLESICIKFRRGKTNMNKKKNTAPKLNKDYPGYFLAPWREYGIL